jgi:WD40 repeat protein
MLASGSNDLTVRLWDVSTGECSLTLQGHTNWVQSVAFSADGKILASGSDDQTVRLWDVSTGKCKRILQEHQGWVWSIAFSPDGQTLASASLDETIKFWDTHTGQCFNTLRSKRLYEGMKITGVTGLTDATITSLKVLGAS